MEQPADVWMKNAKTYVQVWALGEEGGSLAVGGKTNRAVVDFEAELGALLEAVPEWKGESSAQH